MHVCVYEEGLVCVSKDWYVDKGMCACKCVQEAVCVHECVQMCARIKGVEECV